jgi:hypothetical protein
MFLKRCSGYVESIDGELVSVVIIDGSERRKMRFFASFLTESGVSMVGDAFEVDIGLVKSEVTYKFSFAGRVLKGDDGSEKFMPAV